MNQLDWIITAMFALTLLLFLWYVHKMTALVLRIVNELGAIRAAIELTFRSYLGIESVWEAHHRMMGQFGGFVACATAKDLPALSGKRMGELFAEMAAEISDIRKKIDSISTEKRKGLACGSLSESARGSSG
jgi:hypothetical protein